MNRPKPPRIALALLLCVRDRDDPLVGDLLEERASGRSRAWFWRQVVGAVGTANLRGPRPVRPLRLTDDDSPRELLRVARLAARRRTVNVTASPVAHIGGLGLVSLLVLATFVSPGMWWLALAGASAGVALGAVLVVIHRWFGLWTPPHRHALALSVAD